MHITSIYLAASPYFFKKLNIDSGALTLLDYEAVLDTGYLPFSNFSEQESPAVIVASAEYKYFLLRKKLKEVLIRNRHNKNSPLSFVEILSNSNSGKIAIKNRFRTYNNCFCGENSDLYAIFDCISYFQFARARDYKLKILACYFEFNDPSKDINMQTPFLCFILFENTSENSKGNNIKILNIKVIEPAVLRNDYKNLYSFLDQFSCLYFNLDKKDSPLKEWKGIGDRGLRDPNLFLDLVEINQSHEFLSGKSCCLMKRNSNFYLMEIIKI